MPAAIQTVSRIGDGKQKGATYKIQNLPFGNCYKIFTSYLTRTYVKAFM